MVEVHLHISSHTASSHVSYGGERGTHTGEEERKEGEKLGSEVRVQSWGHYLQHLETVHYSLC